MLAKVAEKVYWTGRYLDRIESTARIIAVYNQLLFDLPKDIHFSWYALIRLNQAENYFDQKYQNRTEKNIIKFLLSDKSYPSSILNTLQFIRENVRTSRDVLPEYIWVLINELHLFVEQNLQQGINRNKRLDFLEGIIHGCYKVNGLLSSCMSKDEAWYFMQLGKNIERTDMTSRLLDASVSAYHYLCKSNNDVNLHHIIWGNLLKVLSAEQSFRRDSRTSLKGKAISDYLLNNISQPSAIKHCLISAKASALALPNSNQISTLCQGMIEDLTENQIDIEKQKAFDHFINQHQINIANLHHAITQQWFDEQYL